MPIRRNEITSLQDCVECINYVSSNANDNSKRNIYYSQSGEHKT